MKVRFFLLFLVVFLLAGITISSAEEPDYDGIDKQWTDFLKTLPEDLSSSLPNTLLDTKGSSVGRFSIGGILREIWRQALAGIGSYGKYLIALLTVLLLCAVLDAVKHTIGAGALNEVLSLAGNLAMALTVCEVQTRMIEYVTVYLTTITGISNGIMPIFLSVFAASGNFTLAAVHTGGVSLVLTLIENIFAGILVPILKLCFCFHFMSVFVSSQYFNEVSRILKTVYTTLLVLTMSLFTLVMGAKQILASGADNIIIRGAKYAVGSLVPVVTGVISGSLNTVSAALSVIKNTCGILGVGIVLSMLLPVILSLALNRFVLKLAAGFAGMLGNGGQQRFLNETASVNGYLISLAVCGAVLFIYLLALIVISTLALG